MALKFPETRFDSHVVRLTLITIIVYLAGSLLVNQVATTVGLPIDTALGASLALGVVFGLPVAVGAGLGAILTDLLTGSFGLTSTIDYMAAFFFVSTGIAFWNTLSYYRWLESEWAFVVRFWLAGLPASIVAVSIHAWGADIFAISPFVISFANVILDTILGVFIGGLFLLLIIRRLIAIGILSVPKGEEQQFAVSYTKLATLVLLVWISSGITVSLVFQPLQMESPQAMADQFGWLFPMIVDLVGPAGRRLQVLLGLVAIIVLTICLFGTHE